jgi:glutathione S-transferase
LSFITASIPVCARKVRVALKEKGREAKDHIVTLRGDQYESTYLKLNPNGVVPTLIHDGEPITESSLILKQWVANTDPLFVR